MPEFNQLTYVLEKLGEPEGAQLVPWEEIRPYSGRLPEAMLEFWMKHGRGSYQDGQFWICDPAPFRPVIDRVFADDPEFDPRDMHAICYRAFGELVVWHPERKYTTINFPWMTIFNPPQSSWHNSVTGKPLSDDFLIGGIIAMQMDREGCLDDEGEPLFPKALQKLGRLAPGEIYGFVPAIVLGGRPNVNNLKKVQAAEHLGFLSQLERLSVTRLTPPEPPMHPFGQVEIVRKLGPQG